MLRTKSDDLVLDSAGCCDPDEAFAFASRYLVAGLTTPGRRRSELGNNPFFISRGEGAYLWGLNGKKYIDLNTGHGGSLVGHSHPAIKAALVEAIEKGILCGQETVYPARVAKRLTEMIPGAELVRLMFTGTRATEVAVRVARDYTGKLKVVKFEGHLHGISESLGFNLWPPLDQAGPREAPTVRSESTGVIPEMAKYVSVLPWNDLDLLEDLLKREGDQVAAVIMEPINYNSGVLLPRPGYLEGVRALTKQHGVILIFDEILSCFRTGPDCAQGYLGVTPDLSTVGKAVGGGLPLAALVGRKEVMESLAPVGTVGNWGTFYGQTLVMHAADAFLELAADPAPWAYQEKLGKRLYSGLKDLFRRYHFGHVRALGNRFAMLFGLDEEEIWEYREAARIDHDLERRFYTAAFNHGVYFMHSWHHGYSWAHTEKDIDDALNGIEDTIREALKK